PPRQPGATLFPYTTLFRSDAQGLDRDRGRDLSADVAAHPVGDGDDALADECAVLVDVTAPPHVGDGADRQPDHASSITTEPTWRDRKSTRLNSSHVKISYA